MRFRPAFMLLGLAAACSGEDITVFESATSAGGTTSDGSLSSSTLTDSSTMTSSMTSTETSTETSTTTSTTGKPPDPRQCTNATNCGYYFYCKKTSCDAPFGTCEPRPGFCDPNPRPVCGCDGVTYWNDTQRRFAGIAASTPGACDDDGARHCYIGADCGVVGGFCARLLPPGSTCPADPYPAGEGNCWSVPQGCSAAYDDPKIWLLCPGNTFPPPEHCVHTGWAVTYELVHIPIDDIAECPYQTVSEPPPGR